MIYTASVLSLEWMLSWMMKAQVEAALMSAVMDLCLHYTYKGSSKAPANWLICCRMTKAPLSKTSTVWSLYRHWFRCSVPDNVLKYTLASLNNSTQNSRKNYGFVIHMGETNWEYTDEQLEFKFSNISIHSANKEKRIFLLSSIVCILLNTIQSAWYCVTVGITNKFRHQHIVVLNLISEWTTRKEFSKLNYAFISISPTSIQLNWFKIYRTHVLSINYTVLGHSLYYVSLSGVLLMH